MKFEKDFKIISKLGDGIIGNVWKVQKRYIFNILGEFFHENESM